MLLKWLVRPRVTRFSSFDAVEALRDGYMSSARALNKRCYSLRLRWKQQGKKVKQKYDAQKITKILQ